MKNKKSNMCIKTYIPFIWFRFITNESGEPYHLAIWLLATLVMQCEELSEKADCTIVTNYATLESNLNIKHETLRRAFVKLESLGLVAREIRNIEEDGYIFANTLCVKVMRDVIDGIGSETA